MGLFNSVSKVHESRNHGMFQLLLLLTRDIYALQEAVRVIEYKKLLELLSLTHLHNDFKFNIGGVSQVSML